MEDNLPKLQAMLLIAQTLNYSKTYKEGVISEIKELIKIEVAQAATEKILYTTKK